MHIKDKFAKWYWDTEDLTLEWLFFYEYMNTKWEKQNAA